MQDFAKTYQKVTYFGLWAEETADDYGKRDTPWRSWPTQPAAATT